VGFPVEIVEARRLHGRYHRGIPSRDRGGFSPTISPLKPAEVPTIHMSTQPAHCRVTSSGHLLNEGLGGCYRGNLPLVPWAIVCGPKILNTFCNLQRKRLGNHTPHTRKQLHLSRLKRWSHQLNRNVIISPPYDYHWWTGFHHLLALLIILPATWDRDPGLRSDIPESSLL
jgi:hypothetical protein